MKVLSKKKLLKQYGFPRGYLAFRGLPAVLSWANVSVEKLSARDGELGLNLKLPK